MEFRQSVEEPRPGTVIFFLMKSRRINSVPLEIQASAFHLGEEPKKQSAISVQHLSYHPTAEAMDV